MARSRNSLTEVSASSAQMKSSHTILERSQLDTLRQTSGSLGYGAGKINSDVTGSHKNQSNTSRAKLDIGGLVSENLFAAGHTMKTVSTLLSRIAGSIDNRKPLHRNMPENKSDLSLTAVRVPNAFRKTPNEEIRDKRRELLGMNDEGYEGLKFPLDLEEKAFSYIKLSFFNYRRPSSTVAGDLTRDATYIYLPLPEDMVQDFSVRYNQQDIGGIRQIADTPTARQIISGINAGQSLEQIGSTIDMKTILNDATDTAKNLAFRALATTNIGGLIGQEVGMIPNPHPTVFLDGVDLRQFDFVWKLIPKSKREAEMIHRIIKTLKKKCLPKKDGSYLTYPALVQPTIQGNDEHVDDYKKCLISKININYNGEGTSAFFRDGRPVSIILTLGFQEAELYLEDAPSPRESV